MIVVDGDFVPIGPNPDLVTHMFQMVRYLLAHHLACFEIHYVVLVLGVCYHHFAGLPLLLLSSCSSHLPRDPSFAMIQMLTVPEFSLCLFVSSGPETCHPHLGT